MDSSVSVDALPGFGRHPDGARGVDADHILDLFGHAVTIGRGQVDLVQHGHDFVIRIHGVIDIGEGLRLDALGAVHHQQRPFNRAHGARDLIGEINVARRVDQVEHIFLAVLRSVVDAHGLGLDGDATFAFDIHSCRASALSCRDQPPCWWTGSNDQPAWISRGRYAPRWRNCGYVKAVSW